MPSWHITSKQHVPQAPYFTQAEEPTRPAVSSRLRAAGTRSTSDLGRVDETDAENDYRNTLPPRGSSRSSALPYLRSTPPPDATPKATPPELPAIPSRYADANQNPRLKPAEFNANNSLLDAPAATKPDTSPTLPGGMPSPTESVYNPGPPPGHGHPDVTPRPAMPSVAPLKLKLMPHGRTRQVTEPTAAAAPDQASVEHATESVGPQPLPVDQASTEAAPPTPPPTAQPGRSSTPRRPGTPAGGYSSSFRFPASLPPLPQTVLMPQPPLGPQCQLFEFRYHSEAIPDEENLWLIEMRYKVRITTPASELDGPTDRR